MTAAARIAAYKARVRRSRHVARAANDDIVVSWLIRQGYSPTALREPGDAFGKALPAREWDDFMALDRAARGLVRLGVYS